MSSILKRTEVRLGASGAASPAADAPLAAVPTRPRGLHAKRVELVRVGERVHALELRCSCGETTLVELDYPEDAPNGAPR
jgi:hypothetical protein